MPEIRVHPDEAVGLGATIQSQLVADSANELVVTDVIGYSLGTSVHNYDDPAQPLFSPIIKRNTPIPVSQTES